MSTTNAILQLIAAAIREAEALDARAGREPTEAAALRAKAQRWRGLAAAARAAFHGLA